MASAIRLTSGSRLHLLRIYARLERRLGRFHKMSAGSVTESQVGCRDPVWARRENTAAKLERESGTARISGSQEEPRGFHKAAS